jgi:PTH1 family peptidyl-tRNA hydrolase
VGIGRQTGEREISGYVLSRFSSTETVLVDKVLSTAADQVECWLDCGIQKAMNQFNGTVNGRDNERKEQ